jgi:hypothetical protein
MSVEDFEAATKLAEEKGVAIHDIFFWNDVDSDTLVTPGSRFSITIKSAGNIGSGGRIIPAGEILELPIKDVLPLVKMKVAVRPY